MTITLAQLAYRVAREIGGGILFESVATGGSETTVIDTRRTEADNYWDNGTAFIINTTDDLAPEWEMSIIDAWDIDNFTATLVDTLSATVAAGDRYAFCKKRFQLHVLVQMINNALSEMGLIPYEDVTLTTALAQTEYTLPAAVKGEELRKVFIYTVKDDADDNRPKELFNWSVEFGDTGIADTLLFRRQPPEGYTLRLQYMKPHDELFDDSDELNEHVHINRVVYAAALDAIKWYRDKTRLKDFDRKIDELENKKSRAELQFPIPYPQKPGRTLLGYGYG